MYISQIIHLDVQEVDDQTSLGDLPEARTSVVQLRILDIPSEEVTSDEHNQYGNFISEPTNVLANLIEGPNENDLQPEIIPLGLGNILDPSNVVNVNRGLTKERVDRFERFGESTVGHKCLVCQDDPAIGTRMMRLDCHVDHVFCEQCAVPWFEGHNTCPTCRQAFS